MGNRKESRVEAVGTYRLVLDTGFILDLPNTFYVPDISRNLVSVSKLDIAGYVFNFAHRSLKLFYDGMMIGSGLLCDGLYKFKLDHLYTQSITTHQITYVGQKRGVI